MKKEAHNYLKVFEKIYFTERIKENSEDRISWESQYLRSLREVVRNKEKSSSSYLNLFDLSNFTLRRLPLFHYLLNLLRKESKE